MITSTVGVVVAAILVVALLFLVYTGRRVFGGCLGLYRIVPPNEAHIRVMGNKKEIFSHRDANAKSSYWVVPGITKVNKLPLQNLTVPVNDIKLNDKDMAKFTADVVCFINIQNIPLASERLFLSDQEAKMGFDFVRLGEDFKIIIESIARTTVTKHSILEVYMNRQALAEALTKEVASVFPQWGVQLVNLELKHIKDVQDSTIIADIERKVAANVRRDAEIRVAETTREADIAKATNKQQSRTREIEADKAIGLAQAEKEKQVAEAMQKANAQAVEAKRTIDVGMADINRQTIQKAAEAQAFKTQTEAEGEAKAIKVKKVADAEGTEKLAEALMKFDEKAFNVKQLEVQQTVLVEKFKALASVADKAEIKWIMSGASGQDFFGLNLNAEGGANLQQFLTESGLKALVDKLQPKK